MKKSNRTFCFSKLTIVFLLFSCLLTSINQAQSKKSAVPVIFDTDIGPDYDDVGAMAMLHAFASNGEAKILATIASNRHPLVAPVIDVLNTWFGRPNTPIGAPKSVAVIDGAWQKWPDTLVQKYPHRIKQTDDAEDATVLYRRILSKQPDTSVVIVTVGFLTNISNLLKSAPDKFSSLNGMDLVKKKVKKWVAMAGRFPEGGEFNIHMDSTASQFAIDNWPRPVIFSGFEIGAQVVTGPNLIKKVSADNPVGRVFRICMSKSDEDKNGRKSWDQTALLVGVRGYEKYFDIEKGTFITMASGRNGWQANPAGKHARLVFKMPVTELTKEIEDLMSFEPSNRK